MPCLLLLNISQARPILLGYPRAIILVHVLVISHQGHCIELLIVLLASSPA